MRKEEADKPETVDPPFTFASSEFLIALPLGVLMLVAAGALRVDVTTFKVFLVVCFVAGTISGGVLSRQALLNRLNGSQRTILELLMLLGFASVVSFLLLRIFLEGARS